MSPSFTILDRDKDKRHDRADRLDALASREIPPSLGSHKKAAEDYRPSQDLAAAVNVALAVGAPLLITGEPGTGKTQVSYYLAWYFQLEASHFPLFVRSTTTAEDLLYRFDAVSYLHAAHDTQGDYKKDDQGRLAKEPFLEKGALWKAYETDGPAVVLIDEIDKAPRDFPNDLLNVLDQHTFDVPELDREITRQGPPPIVVITSNSEHRLPEPFLRRCIFHNIAFTDELVRDAVEARKADYPELEDDVIERAVQRFFDLRAREIRKKPATAELLVWLAILSGMGGVTLEHLDGPLNDLPALSALVKDRDDLLLL